MNDELEIVLLAFASQKNLMRELRLGGVFDGVVFTATSWGKTGVFALNHYLSR